MLIGYIIFGMDLELSGRRAIVTGGSRGIGKVIARELAASGVAVVITGRTAATLESTARELTTKTGGRVEAIVGDATSEEAITDLVAGTVELLGGVDILVNNAAVPGGSGGPAGALEAAIADISYDFDAKVLGYLRTARAVAPHLKSQGWGRIINIGGLSARQAGSVAASVRNLALVAVSKSLGDELGPYGVTVNVLHPGRTRTTEGDEPPLPDTNSIGRVVDAVEVAWLTAFLASPRSSAINGEVIGCGGGTPRQMTF